MHRGLPHTVGFPSVESPPVTQPRGCPRFANSKDHVSDVAGLRQAISQSELVAVGVNKEFRKLGASWACGTSEPSFLKSIENFWSASICQMYCEFSMHMRRLVLKMKPFPRQGANLQAWACNGICHVAGSGHAAPGM